jgi:hypothetical protein
MPTDPQQALALLTRINKWALNDIGFDCALVTGCTAPSLPRKQKALWSLLPDKHRDFFNKVTELGEIELAPTVHHNTASYNPTERCGYHRPGDDHPDTLAIRAAAKDFFLGLPVDVIEGQGTYSGPYDFDFAIALDTKNGLIFSFVWNLRD